jgi:hypothetical protein
LSKSEGFCWALVKMLATIARAKKRALITQISTKKTG